MSSYYLINATHLQYQIIGINFALDETVCFVFDFAWDGAHKCSQVILARMCARGP